LLLEKEDSLEPQEEVLLWSSHIVFQEMPNGRLKKIKDRWDHPRSKKVTISIPG
jgi:hypothetical protein